MIATERFVFLHLHKSGGSFVNDCIRRFLPGVREIGYHLPGHLIPPAYARLPVIGLVRNPWSYYVSWYSYQRQRPQPNALFQVLSEDGARDFAGTIGNMLDLGRDEALLERLVARLPVQYGGRGLNLPGFALGPIRGTRRGFYSYLHDYLYGGVPASVHVRRMEALPDALLELFADVGQPVSDELRRSVLAAPPKNPSQHDAWPGYYDDVLRERVAEADAPLIARYGYRFAA
jgi:hypothetical protein